MRRLPTDQQMARLALLANPAFALLTSMGKPEWKALQRRGWLEPAEKGIGLRITPAGLRALADGLEQQRSKEAANATR